MIADAMDLLVAAAAPSAARSSPSSGPQTTPPSFLSPAPVAMTARDLMQRTLSEGARKKKTMPKHEKRKLHERGSGDDSATPLILKRKKKLAMSGDTPLAQTKTSTVDKASRDKENVPWSKDAFLTTPVIEKPRKLKNDGVETATRRLEFAPTPSKPEKSEKSEVVKVKKSDRVKLVQVSDSSSSSEEEDEEEEEHSSASSDECEVTFDAMTLGNMRIIREAVPSPLSTASNASSAVSMQPIGLEYRFSVTSTVSSIAVAPNGKFLVVGFYNGSIYLYPLSVDSLRFRHGVMLDHIPPRGMYTQLMVRVSLPDDGKFIFAGVYRGSTEIRAFEVDSIELPSVERLAQKAAAKASSSDESDDSDDEDIGHGAPSARAISHTYSDAKLKGFSDVKSVIRKSNNQTEYHLLCGLGIKNIHLWRFYRDETAQEWLWECIFDKQSNGISIELLCFHQHIDHQLISKSEHQNIRVWNLEEDGASGVMKKKSHVDIKNTVDATAVHGDHAYGGGETMSLIDLRSSSRMELDLPLSVKEQETKQASSRVNARTRITASLRGRRSATRGRGSNDDGNNGQRLMRMVSQVAGRHDAPFVVGMCTDGSVFMHRPQEETMGLATPLEYVEGYEQYFHDPSLGFQSQFSDITRVNTSGMMAVLPLPETEREDWMVVAANAEQLLVRSFDAFLHRNEQKREVGRVKRGLRNALRDMGRNDSSSESNNDSEDSADDEEAEAPVLPPPSREASSREQKKEKLQLKADRNAIVPDAGKVPKQVKPKLEKKLKESKTLKEATPEDSTVDPTAKLHKPVAPSSESTEKPSLPPKIHIEDNQHTDRLESREATNMVTTPVRKVRQVDGLMSRGVVPSPVVSISSPSSASSNPNTPERVKRLSEADRRSLVANEFQWTPKLTTQGVSNNASDAMNATSEEIKVADPAMPDLSLASKRGRPPKKKSLKARSKGVAQALFTGDEGLPEDDALSVVSKNAKAKGLKRPSPTNSDMDEPRAKKVVVEAASTDYTRLDDNQECTDVEEEFKEPEVEFLCTPLQSDGGSLLAAANYKYSEDVPVSSDLPSRSFTPDEMQLVMRFSSEMERLRRSFSLDRERILRQFTVTECDCGSAKKKTAASSVSKLNWRKQIAGEAAKKKHMKRKHKKQLAAKLKELHVSYEAKLSDARLFQRLEMQAFQARQEILLLATQL